jgi:hypothetical protein
MEEFSLDGFAKFIAAEVAERRLKKAKEAALETAAKMVRDEAKRVIGTYLFDWEQLAASTQSERVAQGFPANEPLLRTGEMRDSIEYKIITPGEEAEVGSNSDKAVWQELGTVTIPPRPFLSSSAAYLERPIKKMAREMAVAAVLPVSIEAEIAKIVMHAMHDMAEAARELVEPDDEPDDETRRR